MTYGRGVVASYSMAVCPRTRLRRCRRPGGRGRRSPMYIRHHHPDTTGPTRWPTARVRCRLGDDNRYHLLVDGQPICTSRARRSRSLWRQHEQLCGWWTDGTAYRIQARSNQPAIKGRHDHRKVRWSVALTETTIDPGLVAKRYRCTINETFGTWPPHRGPGSRDGAILTALVDALGPDYHCCGRFLGVNVDHDPFTGLIRGLVCQDCNSRVDRCPHLSGCLFAEYRNAPPALSLGLMYPRISVTLRAHQGRIDYTGLAPFSI